MAEEKLKILYLMRILLESTDREHILNAAQLCGSLKSQYGITCNRKTIYGDIERLKTFGIDIKQVKGNIQGYYVEKREFELPELKLLVDSVQSSKFITAKKSEELIRKLQRLTSRHNAGLLQRQVFIYNRPKAGNETIFANVDVIHAAIYANRKVTFQYCEWTVRKKLVPKKNGERYVVSPWSLTWDDENYYLVAYDEKADKIKHYRVDKMQEMKIEDTQRLGKECFEGFDLAAFSKKTFGMYGGRDTDVTLYCHNDLVGVILDRFGTDTMIIPADKEHFRVHVLAAVSRQFFGWVTGIGSQMKIAGPENVQREYQEYLKAILEKYELRSSIGS